MAHEVPRTLDPAFIAAVNARFAGEAVLIAQVDTPPRPRSLGPWAVPRGLEVLRRKWLGRLADEGRPNEPHAMLAEDDILADAPYRIVDFATVCAMREAGRPFRLLSAGGLAVCPPRRCVLLQRRGAASIGNVEAAS